MSVLFFFAWYAHAQDTNIEHLTQDFQLATDDTIRLEVMLKCIDHYYEINPDTALTIAYRAEIWP